MRAFGINSRIRTSSLEDLSWRGGVAGDAWLNRSGNTLLVRVLGVPLFSPRFCLFLYASVCVRVCVCISIDVENCWNHSQMRKNNLLWKKRRRKITILVCLKYRYISFSFSSAYHTYKQNSAHTFSGKRKLFVFQSNKYNENLTMQNGNQST